GLVNLGVVAFFAIGAYTAGLLTLSGLGAPPARGAGPPVSPGAGAALGPAAPPPAGGFLPTRASGFSGVSRAFALYRSWPTRGANGITGIPRPLHGWFSAHYDFFYLVLVLSAVLLVYLVLERVRRSPFGRVLRAIREDETVAAVAGKTVVRFKVQAFVI